MIQEVPIEGEIGPGHFRPRDCPAERFSNNPMVYNNDFDRVPHALLEAMNLHCLRIWVFTSELDIVSWVEYVNTTLNIADAPSGEVPIPPIPSYRFFNAAEMAPAIAKDASPDFQAARLACRHHLSKQVMMF